MSSMSLVTATEVKLPVFTCVILFHSTVVLIQYTLFYFSYLFLLYFMVQWCNSKIFADENFLLPVYFYLICVNLIYSLLCVVLQGPSVSPLQPHKELFLSHNLSSRLLRKNTSRFLKELYQYVFILLS